MNCNAAGAGGAAPETNISNFPFNEREIKNDDSPTLTESLAG